MIPRPFTCCCAVLAISSGFFLYTKKHQTTVLDQQISKIVADTERTRSQTAMLRTEWALENQPERLTRLAEHNLVDLHPMDPAQFVRMADLDKHLPSTGRGPAEDPRAGMVSATLASAQTNSAAAPHAPVAVVAEAKPAIRPVAAQTHDHADADDDAAAPHAPTVVADAAPVRAKPPVRAVIRHDVAPHMLDEDSVEAAPVRTAQNISAPTPRPATPHRAPQILADASVRPVAPTTRPTATVASVTPAPQPVVRHTPAVTRVASVTPRATTQDSDGEQQVRHPLPVTVASWHAARARHTPAASPGYVEARATSSYSSASLLGRGDDALPPPVPMTN
ncbi:MAG: hypothetical protein ABF983_06305 [Acetobacter indonesiensis]